MPRQAEFTRQLQYQKILHDISFSRPSGGLTCKTVCPSAPPGSKRSAIPPPGLGSRFGNAAQDTAPESDVTSPFSFTKCFCIRIILVSPSLTGIDFIPRTTCYASQISICNSYVLKPSLDQRQVFGQHNLFIQGLRKENNVVMRFVSFSTQKDRTAFHEGSSFFSATSLRNSWQARPHDAIEYMKDQNLVLLFSLSI
jgi:hypothetical protein